MEPLEFLYVDGKQIWKWMAFELLLTWPFPSGYGSKIKRMNISIVR